MRTDHSGGPCLPPGGAFQTGSTSTNASMWDRSISSVAVEVALESTRVNILGGCMENGQKASGSIVPVERYDVGHVQEVIRQAHGELRQLLEHRAEIMKRIGTVKQTISGLANLFGDGVLNEELMELVDRKSSGRQPGFT